MSIKLKDTIYDLVNNADKIDGIDSTSLFRKLGSNVDINTFADNSNKNGIIYINTTTPASINAPFSYGTILSFNSAAGSWMLGNSSGGTLKFRNRWWSDNGGTWSDWKNIAFTDSNVESASKLATARTITLTGAITGSGSFDGSTNLSIATSVNHTHNYAGSTTSGGSATSAVRLDTTSAGSATQPVYFSGGKPVACTAYSSASVSYAANSGDADTVDSWHKNYFFIGYNGSRHYHLKFGEGAENLAWKTIVKGSTSVTTAPSSNNYIAMTIRGTIWYCNGNHGQMETKMYPFCAVFQCVSAKTIINAAYLWLPPFAKGIDCIRIVRISTNSFELQVRQVASWENGWIDYQILNSGMTVNAYDTLQTAGSGTVVKTAADSSTISEGAMPSHTHEYASTVKVGSTSYTSSGNVVSLPAYPTIPTIPTSLKCPTSLTIQANGTSLGSYDGSVAKTFNITCSNIGAATSGHTHNYAGSSSPGGAATSALTISASAPQLAAAGESNNINIVNNANSSITTNSPESLAAITKAIRFRWYDDYWEIGSIRGSSNKSVGFGFTINNNNLRFRITSDAAYVGSSTVLHTGNWSSYCAAKSHNHSGVLDSGNSTFTTFAYSKAGLNYSDYTWLAGWNGYELRAINKSQFAQASHTHDYAASNHSHSGYMTTSSPTGSGTLMMNGSNSRGSYPAVKWHIGNVNWAQLIMNGSGELELRGGASQDTGYATLRTGWCCCTGLQINGETITFTT
jgi:hypothetical protein